MKATQLIDKFHSTFLKTTRFRSCLKTDEKRWKKLKNYWEVGIEL